jgi:hypothetical protein
MSFAGRLYGLGKGNFAFGAALPLAAIAFFEIRI